MKLSSFWLLLMGLMRPLCLKVAKYIPIIYRSKIPPVPFSHVPQCVLDFSGRQAIQLQEADSKDAAFDEQGKMIKLYFLYDTLLSNNLSSDKTDQTSLRLCKGVSVHLDARTLVIKLHLSIYKQLEYYQLTNKSEKTVNT